jgi:hypothetical protein
MDPLRIVGGCVISQCVESSLQNRFAVKRPTVVGAFSVFGYGACVWLVGRGWSYRERRVCEGTGTD